MPKSTFEWSATAVYYPVASFSVRENSAGLASLSRKAPHVFGPNDAFTFIEKTGGIPFVTPVTGPMAGDKLATHKNHFDADDGYNVARQSGGSVDDRIAMTERRRDQAIRTLAEQEELLSKLHVEKTSAIQQKIEAEAKAQLLREEAEAAAALKKEAQDAVAEELAKQAAEAAEEVETGPSDEEAEEISDNEAMAEAEEAIAEEGGVEEDEPSDDQLDAIENFS